MRRFLLATALGGVLLTGAACSGDADPTPTTAAAPATTAPSSAPTSPPPNYSANTKAVCGRVEKIFSEDLQDFGAQIGKMIAYKEAKDSELADRAEKAAAKELRDVGAKVKKETAAAQDPELKAAGAASAAKFVKSSKDTKLFDAIRTTKDLDRTIESRMTEWLTPVAGLCA